MLSIVEFIRSRNIAIDSFMVDRFWSTLQDNRLIYVDDELIRWMGYESASVANRKTVFMKILASKTEGVDYFHYSGAEYSEHILIPYAAALNLGQPQGDTAALAENLVLPLGSTRLYPEIDRGHGKGTQKHLLLTPKCLKIVMMQVSTAKGDQVREYYFTIEMVFKEFVQYHFECKQQEQQALLLQSQEQAAAAANKLAIAETRILNITSYIDNVKPLVQSEYIYIGTTDVYAASNQYKLGRSTNIRLRLPTYNTGRAAEDQFYFCWYYKCADSVGLERRLGKALVGWQASADKEMYVLNYDILVDLVELVCRHDSIEIAAFNQVIAGYGDICARPIVKPPRLTEIDGYILYLEPAAIPAPLPAILPASQPDPDEIILTVQLTRRAVQNIIADAVAADREYKSVVVRIKALLPRGTKNKFKVTEWRDLLVEAGVRR
jgi:MSV199 domain